MGPGSGPKLMQLLNVPNENAMASVIAIFFIPFFIVLTLRLIIVVQGSNHFEFLIIRVCMELYFGVIL